MRGTHLEGLHDSGNRGAPTALVELWNVLGLVQPGCRWQGTGLQGEGTEQSEDMGHSGCWGGAKQASRCPAPMR
jgi:hypothetical protein